MPDLNRKLQISVGTAGPHSGHCRASTLQMDTAGLQPQALDLSGHCRTSTASPRSQRALPDLNCKLPVGIAGPQPQAPDLSGHCRTLFASFKFQWPLPDLNRKLQISMYTAGLQPRASDLTGHCRTLTAWVPAITCNDYYNLEFLY